MTHNLPHGGAMVALATPLDEAGRLDGAALEGLVRRTLDAGIRGVCPVGSTGEGARLTVDQRAEVTRRVLACVDEGVPVVPAVPVTSLPAALAELDGMVDAVGGTPTAVLVSPPSYYPASPAELLDLFSTLADAAPAPLVLYNIPMFTTVALPVPVVAELARHPRVAGIKDSSRDMEYLVTLLGALTGVGSDEFAVYTGSDTLLTASLAAGAVGTIAASANLVPGLSAGICAAVEDDDGDRAAELQRRLVSIVMACRRGLPPSGWKAALALAGLCRDAMVAPGQAMAADQQRELAADLNRLGVLEDPA